MKRTPGLLIILALCAAAVAVAYQAHGRRQQQAQQAQLQARRSGWERLKPELWREVSRFPGRAGIYVEDLRTGWKVGHREREPVPAASLVKIPIMAACFLAEQEGRLRFSETLTLEGAAKANGSGLLKTMPNGSTWTIGQLVEVMITHSDNTATNLLIDRIGLDYLNDSFRRMGLQNTVLTRKMMDFRLRGRGVENYSTPEDVALMLAMLYRGRLVNEQVSARCIEMLKRQKLRDRIPALLPEGTVVAHKTGLEKGVCHDAGIVFTPGGDLLVCVMTEGAPAAATAKKAIARIALSAYRYLVTGSDTPAGKS